MNELLAIIIIVVVCCAMFIAWLVSMATCPDAMVDLISGTRRRPADYSSSDETKAGLMTAAQGSSSITNLGSARSSSVYSQLDGSRRYIDLAGKKLSMVPEVDEQLTIQSKLSAKHPTILSIRKTPEEP